MQSSAAVADKLSVKKLESLYTKDSSIPKKKFGGGGNNKPPGGNHGGRGGGGDSDGHPFGTNNISSEDKFFLKGKFAKQCLNHFMPETYFEHLE